MKLHNNDMLKHDGERMDKYKMVCLDIDGTLLNSRHEITENTAAVIQAVNERHIPVILVSARMPKGILSVQRKLQILHPIICYNGAMVWESGKVLLNTAIPAGDIGNLYRIIQTMGLNISVYKDDEWYVQGMDPWTKQEADITSITPSIMDLPELLSLWVQENAGAHKLMCMAEP
jgi:HAD superfamily hydrolase (TIGR01484 family)